MTGEELEPYERFVLDLAGGVLFSHAAIAAGLKAADAMREAKAFGWPDRNAIRQAAQDIRDEHSREESNTMARTNPPSRREPIPIEPDVEDAMTAGAALIREARASVALDRDETHAVDEAPPMAGHGLDAAVEFDAPTWRAEGVTDEQLAADVPEASTAAIDRELMADTGAILRFFDRVDAPVLNAEQLARAESLRVAAGLAIEHGATTGDLIALADFIATGSVVTRGMFGQTRVASPVTP